jgi:predicted acylesterase/phospholipase RssA
MPMTAPRPNIAIAVDGGGMRGYIVAEALTALESELGGTPLVKNPAVKVIAGASTGSLISGALAIGMTAREIADMYINTSRTSLASSLPGWIPRKVDFALRVVLLLRRPYLYTNTAWRKLLRDTCERMTGNPDLTMGQLGKMLRKDQVLVVTVMDVVSRRTLFLKSNCEADKDWKVWQAILASASPPGLVPAVEVNGRYYTDGAIGNYGNPSAVAAHEAITWGKRKPGDVSVFSFGCGWVDSGTKGNTPSSPANWGIVQWLRAAYAMASDDATRAQSVDIINDYILAEPVGMDFRRFQFALRERIPIDDTSDVAFAIMRKIGEAVGERVRSDQHALGEDESFDPEGLRASLERRLRSKGITEPLQRILRRVRTTNNMREQA